jgi:3-hydroxy-3-methylglutaryl CoA synthase
MVGIVSYGGYVPRLRLQRKSIAQANAWFNAALGGMAKAERSMCNWDEDSVTMAVEAARDCLNGFDKSGIAALHMASTTMPFADRQNSGIVSAALNLGEAVQTVDVTSSQRAATSGLIAAIYAAIGENAQVLFAAADSRRTKAGAPQEMLFGDGAATLLIGHQNVIADFKGAFSVAVDFVDHYRGSTDEFDNNWEERWVRDEGYMKIAPKAVKGLLDKVKLKGSDVDRFIMPCVLSRVAEGVAKSCGIAEDRVRGNLHAEMGESGTAHSLVMLAHALESAKAGQRIMVVGFGQGCDAILFEVTAAIANLPKRIGIGGSLKRRKEETNYNKFLAFNDLVARDKGLRSENDKQTAVSALYRKRDMLTGLIGGKCRKCGTVQFPKSRVCVNPNCGTMNSQDDHPFADTPAKVNSFTCDYLTFSHDPPAQYGMVQFAEGGRFMADFTDVDIGKVEVGQPMRMVFRIKELDDQRGFTRYFWKAAPAAKEA